MARVMFWIRPAWFTRQPVVARPTDPPASTRSAPGRISGEAEEVLDDQEAGLRQAPRPGLLVSVSAGRRRRCTACRTPAQDIPGRNGRALEMLQDRSLDAPAVSAPSRPGS